METLDKNTLLAKKAEIESNFETIGGKIRTIEVQEKALSQQKTQYNVELFRLQGEFRVIQNLLGEEEQVPEEPQVEAPVPPAEQTNQ